jgi:hypothetical protein
MFTTVSGYFVGTLSYGAAPKFALRTNKGEAIICCKAAPPVMRENDIICVVLWKNEVVSISNLGTGTEIQYRVLAPEGPYWHEDHFFTCLLLSGSRTPDGLLGIFRRDVLRRKGVSGCPGTRASDDGWRDIRRVRLVHLSPGDSYSA